MTERAKSHWWCLGEDDGPPLLGAYTLEGLALAVDPVEQRLAPSSLIMYQLE